MMNHNLTQMCNDCPFRKNAVPGWLGSYTSEKIIELIQIEVLFPCHKHVEEAHTDEHHVNGYDQDDWAEWAMAHGEQCAGFNMLMGKMCKLPRDRTWSDHVNRTEPSDNVFETPQAFIDYHQPSELPRGQRT